MAKEIQQLDPDILRIQLETDLQDMKENLKSGLYNSLAGWELFERDKIRVIKKLLLLLSKQMEEVVKILESLD